LWQHGPQKKCELEGIVEWDPVQEEIGKDFNHGEEAVNNPVDEPLGLISAGWLFDGEERFVSGVDKAYNGAKRSNPDSKKDKGEEEK
jgi:hypothetical protein